MQIFIWNWKKKIKIAFKKELKIFKVWHKHSMKMWKAFNIFKLVNLGKFWTACWLVSSIMLFTSCKSIKLIKHFGPFRIKLFEYRYFEVGLN